MTIEADLPDALANVLDTASVAAMAATDTATPATALRAPLDRAWIAAHIPHSGAMCLLDTVEAWDEARIRCSATSHRDPRNPLRSRGRLAAVSGIEYAAQAMAVHGALHAVRDGALAGRPRVGYLASVRNVEARIARLDTLDAALVIEAERVSGDGNSILYGFTVRCDEHVLLKGRAAVVLDASAVIR